MKYVFLIAFVASTLAYCDDIEQCSRGDSSSCVREIVRGEVASLYDLAKAACLGKPASIAACGFARQNKFIISQECDRNDPFACYLEASLERGSPFDLLKSKIGKKAIELSAKSCENGEYVYCAFYGRTQAIQKKFRNAIRIFDKGCRGGEAASCMELGNSYAESKIQMEFYQRACALGSKISCTKMQSVSLLTRADPLIVSRQPSSLPKTKD